MRLFCMKSIFGLLLVFTHERGAVSDIETCMSWLCVARRVSRSVDDLEQAPRLYLLLHSFTKRYYRALPVCMYCPTVGCLPKHKI